MATAALRRKEAAEVQTALGRCQELLDQQDASLRSLRSLLHQRSASVASTMRMSTVQSTASTFYIECEKRYNQDLQDVIHDTAIDPFVKREKLQELITNFEAEAGKVAQKFLQDYLGDDASSITWASAERQAYGACLSVTIMDYEDSSVALARKEQSMQYLMLMQQIAHMETPAVTVSPRTLVHYRGRTMLVASEIGPLQQDNSLDASRCPELRAALGCVTDSHRLRRYRKLREDGKEEVVVGPMNAKAFRATDGRYYVESIFGMMPHFPPAKGTMANKDQSLFLRPEAVLDPNCDPLSPGAFVVFGVRDSASGADDVRAAAAHVSRTRLVELAALLSSNPPADAASLIHQCHDNGINVAMLAVLHHHVTNPDLSNLIYAEMIARAMRDLIRRAMAQRIDEDDIKEVFAEGCAALCNGDRNRAYYDEVVVPVLEKKFIGFATLSDVPRSRLNMQFLDLNLWLRRFADLLGVKLARGVTAKGTNSFHFTVDAMDPVVKRYSLPLFRVNAAVYVGVGTTTPTRSSGNTTQRDGEVVSARLGFVAMPSEEKAQAYMQQRANLSGVSSSDYIYSCYDTAAVLYRSALFEDADSWVDKCLEIAVASPNCRKSRIIGSARGLKGLIAVAKQQFGEAAKHLNLAIKILTSPKFSGHSALGSPEVGMSDSPDESLSAAIKNVSVFFPSQPSSSESIIYAKALANIYEDRGLREEAEPHYRFVLEICRQLYGNMHAKVSGALNDLAVNLFSQEQYNEAEELYLEDLKLSETLYGPTDLNVANSLNNLACLYDRLERFEESEPLYRRDIAISVAILGELHPDVATSRNNIASSLFQQDRFPEAAKEYEHALRIRREYFGNRHVSVAETLNNVAAMKRKEGKLEEAKKLWEEALSVYEECVGKTHHSLLTILDNMQSLAEEMDDVENAENLMERALEIKRAETEAYRAQQSAVTIQA